MTASVSEMADAEFDDFADQLWHAVSEAAPLWEVPLGATELRGDGTKRVHGPWLPADCSAALVLWFDAGLVGLYRDDLTQEDVPPVEAAGILRSPEHWPHDADDAPRVGLVATDAGSALPWEGWRALLEPLRTRT